MPFSITVNARGGQDEVSLYDSPLSNDLFVSKLRNVRLSGPGFFNRATGFETIDAYASSADKAKLYDSAGNDIFHCAPDLASMEYDSGPTVRVHDFVSTFGFASSGDDTAFMQDAADSADRLVVKHNFGKLRGPGFFTKALRFDNLTATATPGQRDVATFYDSTGSDIFEATPGTAKIIYGGSATRAAQADGFRRVYALANAADLPGSVDKAYLFDSPGDDVLRAYADYTKLYNNTLGFFNRAKYFDEVHATGGGLGQNDMAHLYDSAGDDLLEYGGTSARVSSNDLVDFLNEVTAFKHVRPHSDATGADTKISSPMTVGYDLDDSDWL